MSAVLQGVGGPGWEARICKVGVQFSSQIVPSWVLTQVAESDNGGQGPSAGSGGGNVKALLVWQGHRVLSAPEHRLPQVASPNGSVFAQALFTLRQIPPCTLEFG